MPKKTHDILKREAKKKGLTGDKYDAYVFGSLDKIQKHDTRSKNKKRTYR